MDKQDIFSQTELENYAEVMIWGLKKAKKKPLQKNSFVEIKFNSDAAPLAEKIYQKLL